MRNKISGVVVVYKPDLNVSKNIETYIKMLDELYIIDNSDSSQQNLFEEILKKYPKIRYVAFNENLGIAKALNVGVDFFLKSDSEWLLTMDQDSKFSVEDLEKFVLKVELEKNIDEIGILSPTHKTTNKTDIIKEDKFVQRVMTSGNLVSKKIFQQVGKFNEEFFIDEVDHEYCLRVIRKGFKIKVYGDIYLEHSLGEMNRNNRLPKYLIATNHSALRRYYITRNKLYVAKEYPEVRKKYILTFINDFIKIILFEQEKIEKLKMIKRAYRDYRKGIFGKYQATLRKRGENIDCL